MQVGIKVGQKFGTNLLGAGLGEDVPEAQRLVAGARDDRLAVGRHGEVEHPVRVAGQLGHLHERRVLPHQDLVLRVAVCGDLGAKNDTVSFIHDYLISIFQRWLLYHV